MCNDWGWGGVLDSMFLKAAQEQLWREWEVEAKGGGGRNRKWGWKDGNVEVRGGGCPGPEGFERHKELQLPEDPPPSARSAYITGLIKLVHQRVM